MKLTKERKACVGLLLLAVFAFGIDRRFFTPSAASAGEHRGAAPPAPGKKNLKPGFGKQEDELRDLSVVSDRLQTAAKTARVQETPLPDAFQPPAQWVKRSIAKSSVGTPTAADRFRARHHLAAVMTAEQGGWAIVDGNTITLGQTLGGFRLTAVGDHSALFQSADAQVELQLPK